MLQFRRFVKVCHATVLLGVLWLAMQQLLATQFDPLTVEALARQAELVVQGTVLSKTCQRDPAGRIYTKVELEVTDVWKGAVTGSPMVLVHGGGILGEQRSVV